MEKWGSKQGVPKENEILVLDHYFSGLDNNLIEQVAIRFLLDVFFG